MRPSTARRHDVIVVGLGIMGSSAAAALCRRGLDVLGLDRLAPPHVLGSSHGETRMIREAYYEDPGYVPLVRRAWRMWEALEDEVGLGLIRRTGGLMIGPEDGELIDGVRASAREHGLPVEELTPREVGRRFPPFAVPEDRMAILERRAGYLHAERCVDAFLQVASTAGAELRYDEPVRRWEADAAGVEVRTPTGARRADRLVLAAGPWTPGLLPGLRLPLTCERQVQLWFAPVTEEAAGNLRPERFPVFLREEDTGAFWYGFPEVDLGVKVARHHGGGACTPESVDRRVTDEDVEAVRELVAAGLPDAGGELLRGAVCLYTNTPDAHFLVDLHPATDRVAILSPCSGHGFKFAPVIGEIAAELTTRGRSRLPLEAFGIGRFG